MEGNADEGVGATVEVATRTPPVKGVIVANGDVVEVGSGVEVFAGAEVLVGKTTGIAAKFAVTVLLLFIMSVCGFVVPPKSTDQPVNRQPDDGTAVSCTELFKSNVV